MINSKENYYSILHNFNINQHVEKYNLFMSEFWSINNIQQNLVLKYDNNQGRKEMNDFSYWYGTVKYIYENQCGNKLPNSYSFLEDIIGNIQNAEYIWYEIYYRYFLIYLEEIFHSSINQRTYGFTINYRLIIELELFLHTYHNLNKDDKIFYGVIAYSLNLGGFNLMNSPHGNLHEFILPYFYKYVGEEKKKKYDKFAEQIFNKGTESNIMNKVLFTLKNNNNKIKGINISDELDNYYNEYYQSNSQESIEKYSDPSKLIHPNNFDILNECRDYKFNIQNQKALELFQLRLKELNNKHIIIILNIFSGKETEII